ncbi:MAG TPA: HAD hydrolase family protein [Acidisarcina sp.]|nr:HAD hydrolase family protein [Acidisarcina sp.]
MQISAEDRARRIKIILFDVDGVLTDGSIWMVPVSGASPSASEDSHNISSARMVEAKGFSAHDGTAISLARIAGMKCGVITKRISDTVALRARDLKLEFVYMGQAYKMRAVREILDKEGATLEEIAYVGDDVIDLPVMRECGLAIAVANAREQVKAAAHFVTENRGGDGAGRDAIEFILKSKGQLEESIERYIDESNPLPAGMDIGKGGF